jgi:hypothetical protein
MAGKKGRSGRKPRDDGKKMRAVNLYIPMYESYGWNKTGKISWIPEDWFRQFKRIYGSRWQEKVRWLIMKQTKEFERSAMWDCECKNRLHKWHFKHESVCPRCDYEPYDMQRYKTKAQVRAHSKEEKNAKPLTQCPTCKDPLTLEMDVHGRHIMKCRTCHP